MDREEKKSEEKRRRNFLMNPYGRASIRYGEMVIYNRMIEGGGECVHVTRDNRFLVTANPDGTLCIYPMCDILRYRIALETDRVTVTHILVEKHITQVLPNHTVGPDGVTTRMMLPGQDCFQKWPAPDFTVTLYDQVHARRFDFRNGKGEDDYWVSIMTLTTETPGQRFPIYDRIIRVGYNGHFITDLLRKFVGSRDRVFGLGFISPKNDEKIKEEAKKSEAKTQTSDVQVLPGGGDPPVEKAEEKPLVQSHSEPPQGDEKKEEEPASQSWPEQSQPPTHSNKPLAIPSAEVTRPSVRRPSVRRILAAAASQASEAVSEKEESSLSVATSQTSKAVSEKKEKKKESDAVKIALIQNISKTLNRLISKTFDEIRPSHTDAFTH